MLSSPLVRYNHKRHDCGSEASVTDILAGSAPQLQMCLHLLQKCMSQTYMLFQSKVLKNIGFATGLIVSWSCYRHNCWPGVFVSDMYAGSIPHNQTCVMVKMSTDHLTIMAGPWAGLLVWYKYKIHAH